MSAIGKPIGGNLSRNFCIGIGTAKGQQGVFHTPLTGSKRKKEIKRKRDCAHALGTPSAYVQKGKAAKVSVDWLPVGFITPGFDKEQKVK